MASVTVAADIFTRADPPYDDSWDGSPCFLVESEDREGAAAALNAAGFRFMSIDEEGRELEPWELEAPVTYTPNYVSDVLLLPEGPMIWVDTQGGFSTAMGQMMLDVLVAELDARDVSAHIAAPPLMWNESSPPTWRRPPGMEPPDEAVSETVSKSWYIGRDVATKTTTGRHYYERVWRTADGRWVTQRSTAERFDDPPVDLIKSLREEPRRPELGEVNGLLVPDDDSDTGAMPPEAIRQRPQSFS